MQRSWRKCRAWASLCAEERGTESWIPFGEGVKMPMWRPDLRTQPSGLHVRWAGSLSSIPEFSLRCPGDGQQRTLVLLSEPQGRCGSVRHVCRHSLRFFILRHTVKVESVLGEAMVSCGSPSRQDGAGGSCK